MHDHHGNILKVGDKVSVPAVVKSISPGADYCNLTLETEHPMHPGNDKTSILLNAKQVHRMNPHEDKTADASQASPSPTA